MALSGVSVSQPGVGHTTPGPLPAKRRLSQAFARKSFALQRGSRSAFYVGVLFDTATGGKSGRAGVSIRLTGHLNTLLPLGQALQKRGHRVTLVGVLDAEPPTRAAGLEFRPLGEAERPAGAMAKLTAQASTLSGRAALRYAIAVFQQDAALLLREAPAVIKAAGIDVLLVDQALRGGGTVAEHLNLPFITLCSTVVLNREPTIPPFYTAWNYHPA